MASAQQTAPAPHDAGDAAASSRLYYWKSQGNDDVYRWLKVNEPLMIHGDACTVGYYWFDEKTKVSTSNYLVASFVVTPEDEEVTRIIRDTESGADARVGVRYHAVDSEMSEIWIALAFEGDPDDVFDEMSAVKARSIRDRNWRLLEVEKPLQSGSRLYEFHLTCENGRTAFSFPKKPKHQK